MKNFPVGGPRQPVYDFLTSKGFVMSNWSDKAWSRPSDGVEVRVYGAGSMAQVTKGGTLLVDAPLAEAVKHSYGDK
jgi:hypothetical protein